MDVLRTVLLIGATTGMGVMAGVFFVYATAVMPGLRTTDDRTFVGAFQAIDRAIINPAFMFVFLGTLLTTAATGVLHLPRDERAVLPWVVVALTLYLVVVVSTVTVNVPRNDAIKAAGAPDQIADLGLVRRRFNEAKWARWNLARTVMTTAAFMSLVGALIEL